LVGFTGCGDRWVPQPTNGRLYTVRWPVGTAAHQRSALPGAV